jgi:putative spermidine/putrescine transport system permease protein
MMKQLQDLKKNLGSIAPTLPSVVLLIVCFVIPIFSLLLVAFYGYSSGAVDGIDYAKGLTLSNFIGFAESVFYVRVLLTTLQIAIVSSVSCLLISYPVAYYIARPGNRRFKRILFVLIVVSFFMNAIVRLYSWILMLGDYGVINSTLALLHLPTLNLLHTDFGIEIAIVQWTLPVVVLTLVGSFRNLRPALLEASESLGATRVGTFFHVTLPLTLPGVISAFLLAYTLNMGAFTVPVILGGGIVNMLASQIYSTFLAIDNYPLGATLSVMLLLTSLLASYAINTVLSRRVKIR